MLQIIKNEFFSCKICNSIYTEDNYPYSLSCNQTLCKKCKDKMILKNSCPFDPSHSHTEDNIARNLNLKHIMDDISKLIEINKNKNKYDKELDDFIYRLKQKNKKSEYQNEDIIFKGILKDNKPVGKGELIHKNIGIFTGLFYGEFHKGKGVISYNDNNIYSGEWENYKRQNKGVLKFSNLDEYKGEFKDDLFDGHGLLFINAEKTIYDGTWIKGKKEGIFKILNEKGEFIKIENYKNDIINLNI